ncbi:FAD-dependent oxidoreductase [Mangrovitalea sediminis]|uniref:FAD-dependent oxidoreductase n=1 Tax=Mangrovitalea sediminis TaxID=1982043 RepID=UPI000BE60F3C|nr:bifunctional TVP38/TMEM64 family protein/FAD-dependent oxidoreductase [Mangrovitalea sediminis]
MTRLGKPLLLGLVIVAITAFFALGLQQYLSLAWLKQEQASLAALIAGDPATATAVFMLIYVLVTALSLPGATVMTLAGGALFGLAWGLIMVSFASSVGASLAFLASRYLFRDGLQRRYARALQRVDAGIARDGAFYLASLRLVPVFPFFVINLVMGLTGLRLRTFYVVSQLAMLPGTFIYVNAGTQLGQIAQPRDILSAGLLLSLTLLGLFPLVAKFVLARLQRARLYRGFQRPKRFDYNLLVIGAGSAGLVSAYIASAVKARVGLIERDRMGGDCLNTGCVPSKALIRSAGVADLFRHADRYGLPAQEPDVPFGQVMERVQSVIQAVEPHDSVARYSALGVDCIQGEARFVSPWELEVSTASGTRRLSARSTVIATGGRPFLPPIPGLESVAPLTSDTIWSLRKKPERLLVLGGGPIGAELSQAFARLGVAVTLVEAGDRLLSREDEDVSAAVLVAFQKDGIDVRLGHRATRFVREDGEKVLYTEHRGEHVRLPFDQLLVAVGRAGNTAGLGLEVLGIEPAGNGTLPVAEDLSVRYPNLFACGDVAGPYQFTHTAAHQAWYAAVNGLFGGFRRFKADYRVIPWVTFTAPEVGRVGLNEREAQAQGVAYEVTRYNLDDLDRAIVDSAAQGFIKVLTPPGKDRILGVTVMADHAAEILSEFILAMKHGIGLNKILATIHPYPTWNEAVKYTAGNWKRAHAPASVLGWLGRYHRWRLGGSAVSSPTTPSEDH